MATENEQLRELMFGAKDRYHSARAIIRNWRDERTADELRKRFSVTNLYREAFGPPSPQASGYPPGKPSDFERVWKVWHERPDRWRQEAALPDGAGTEYRVMDGKAFWFYNPNEGAHAATAEGWFGPEFEIAFVFDPESGAPDISYLEMRVTDRVRHAGREALRVEATKPGGWETIPEPVWWGADDYELVVDAERGTILRLASRLEGRAFDATEVLEVGFDEAFPEGTFAPELPGVEFGRVERLR